MYKKLVDFFLQRFVKSMGRAPGTPKEWMDIQNQAVRHLNKTKGAPSIKKDPFQGFTPKIVGKDAPSIKKDIPGETKITIDDLLKGPVRSKGPKGDRIWDFSQKSEVIPFPPRGIHAEAQKRFPKQTHQFFGRPLKDKDFTKIDELVEKGVITPGKAPKTKKTTLDAKKGVLEEQISKEEWIARRKQDNKDAIRRFKEKNPDKFQYGGIAPLVGEPSYSADFYDDRIPYAGGALVKGGRWFLKSLYDTKKQLMQLDIPLSKKQELMKQADDAIKQIEGGAPIPEQIIQHIRKDPKIKSMSQGPRATDPDLAEMEEVIIEYGKKHRCIVIPLVFTLCFCSVFYAP